MTNDNTAPQGQREREVPGQCVGELCGICGQQAIAKVEEVIFDCGPMQMRHPLTQYLCADHASMVLQPYRHREGGCPFCEHTGVHPRFLSGRRAPTQEEGEPHPLAVCEAGGIILRVGQVYRVYAQPDCPRCQELAAAYNPSDWDCCASTVPTQPSAEAIRKAVIHGYLAAVNDSTTFDHPARESAEQEADIYMGESQQPSAEVGGLDRIARFVADHAPTKDVLDDLLCAVEDVRAQGRRDMSEPRCTRHDLDGQATGIRMSCPIHDKLTVGSVGTISAPTVTFSASLCQPQLPDLHRESVVICRGSVPGYGWHGTTIIHAASETCVICEGGAT